MMFRRLVLTAARGDLDDIAESTEKNGGSLGQARRNSASAI